MITDVKIWVEIEEIKNHEYLLTKSIPETVLTCIVWTWTEKG